MGTRVSGLMSEIAQVSSNGRGVAVGRSIKKKAKQKVSRWMGRRAAVQHEFAGIGSEF